VGQVERISVEVPAEAADALREAVEMGEHASVDEAVREALEAWWRDRTPEISDERLGRLWDEGLASGEPQGGPEALARVRARLEALIAERHGPGA
jgi:antitoxin ParD1/3/4